MTNANEQISKGSTASPQFDELPLEILLLIFEYCHALDLVRLRAVCTRFYDVVNDEVLWYRRTKHSIATNQVSKRFRARCNPVLCQRTKWQVTHNWEYGRYQKRILFSQPRKLMPWIQLTGDVLWWSGESQLCGYWRSDPFNVNNKIYHQDTHSDICKFIVRDDYIISGHRDGNLKFWFRNIVWGVNYYYTGIEDAHSRDINAVDETGNLVITGSADGVVKAWTSPRDENNFSNLPLATIRISDRIWSLAADPTGSKVAIGSSGTSGPALYICDTINFNHSHVINHQWRQGAGILDMVWENPHTLLTCGYDTCIRKWDLRIGKCVSYWSDPTDATIYCISSDYNYTMVTGTQFNCKAVLWDQRKPQYVQLYFMNLRRMSSPVYSVSFDSSHLYGATDQTVIEVKFSGQPNIKQNYREIMKYEKLFET